MNKIGLDGCSFSSTSCSLLSVARIPIFSTLPTFSQQQILRPVAFSAFPNRGLENKLHQENPPTVMETSRRDPAHRPHR